MLRSTLLAGLVCLGALQPVFGDDYKFKVTSNKDFELVLTVFGGPLMMLDACWSNAKTDLDWVVICDFPEPLGVSIAAISASDEEKCEDFQIGVFGGDDGIVCTATLFSNGGTGKGHGAFRFTGTERSNRSAVAAMSMSLDKFPEFRTVIEDAKAASRKRKRAK